MDLPVSDEPRFAEETAVVPTGLGYVAVVAVVVAPAAIRRIAHPGECGLVGRSFHSIDLEADPIASCSPPAFVVPRPVRVTQLGLVSSLVRSAAEPCTALSQAESSRQAESSGALSTSLGRPVGS